MPDIVWEIDLKQLVVNLWRRLWIIIIVVLVMGGSAYAWTYYMITPLYESSALLYVNNSSITIDDSSYITSSELSAAQSLVDTYIAILFTRNTLYEVIDSAGINYSYDELKDMIDASSVNGTEIFRVTVTCSDPYESQNIANTIATVLPIKISEVVEGSSARIVDYAILPSSRSYPRYKNNIFAGCFIGAFLCLVVTVVWQILDTQMHSETQLTGSFNYPLLASIPRISAPRKDGLSDQEHAKPDNKAKAKKVSKK